MLCNNVCFTLESRGGSTSENSRVMEENIYGKWTERQREVC